LESNLEISVINLILNATLFTKAVLLLLLLTSIISWAIMIQKYLFLAIYKSDISRFLKTVSNQSGNSFIEETCIHFSKGTAKNLPILIAKMLKVLSQGKIIQSPETVVNNTVMYEAEKLQSGMQILSTAANISPLLGLLGTVWGIMYSFIRIGSIGNASISTVAPGIAEALITTIAGIVVAIPAHIGFNLLSAPINSCLDHLDRISEFTKSIFTSDGVD
jgi:biopolymer transport protein TolQ